MVEDILCLSMFLPSEVVLGDGWRVTVTWASLVDLVVLLALSLSLLFSSVGAAQSKLFPSFFLFCSPSLSSRTAHHIKAPFPVSGNRNATQDDEVRVVVPGRISCRHTSKRIASSSVLISVFSCPHCIKWTRINLSFVRSDRLPKERTFELIDCFLAVSRDTILLSAT